MANRFLVRMWRLVSGVDTSHVRECGVWWNWDVGNFIVCLWRVANVVQSLKYNHLCKMHNIEDLYGYFKNGGGCFFSANKAMPYLTRN